MSGTTVKAKARDLYEKYISDNSASLVLDARKDRLDHKKPPRRLVGNPIEGVAEVFTVSPFSFISKVRFISKIRSTSNWSLPSWR